MRRKDKKIESESDITEILQSGKICYLSVVDGGKPYVVPLNYGYSDGALFFHSSPQGRKIDVIKRNPEVCFSIVSDYRLVRDKKACSWSTKYSSVIGTGKALILTDLEDIKTGLAILMEQYSDEDYDFAELDPDRVTIIKVKIQEITGKRS